MGVKETDRQGVTQENEMREQKGQIETMKSKRWK